MIHMSIRNFMLKHRCQSVYPVPATSLRNENMPEKTLPSNGQTRFRGPSEGLDVSGI